MDSEAMAAVAAAFGHTFTRPELLRAALTHRSFAHERAQHGAERARHGAREGVSAHEGPGRERSDNERLEFLGDAVLGLVVARVLWDLFPGASEGELTRRRADLVCERSLAELARRSCIGPALLLGRGEDKSGGRSKPRLLASAFEACVGALYLDAGFDATAVSLHSMLETLAHEAPPGAADYKSRAQQLVQARGRPAPQYRLVRTEGPDHARTFHVEFMVDEGTLAAGSGRSKLEAEQAAARAWIERETVLSPS